MVPSMNDWLKPKYILIGLAVMAVLAILIRSCTTIDFTYIKQGLKPMTFEPKVELASGPLGTDYPEKSRDLVMSASRAKLYLAAARRDFYNGKFDDALRRLDRARWYDPENFGILKLTGQIFFERAQFRKAYDEWMLATLLPNDDRLIGRDLDVLKRLIRYSRNEIDRLQRQVYRNPGDALAAAKLQELEKQLGE